MKRSPLAAAATFALLVTSALVASQSYAQDQTLPDVKVTGEAADDRHPQDPNYSVRPLGCVEIVTPRSAGNGTGGYFQAKGHLAGIPVMPDLNDPSSASDQNRRGPTYEHAPSLPPGYTSSTPPCR